MSVEQIEALYSTHEARERLWALYALRGFLASCIIGGDYKVPSGLHTPIVLTKYGEKVLQRLRKEGVPFPEARLLCFLEMLGPEPLVDIDGTNIDALSNIIGKQIRTQELRFPFVFGRELYDKFNGIYVEEKGSLSYKETRELLTGTPQGVFQLASYVCGPYGLLTSQAERTISPRRAVPLQLCSDPSCDAVHIVSLDTSYEADINEHRSKMTKILAKDGLAIDTWMHFMDRITTPAIDVRESYGEPLIVLIADSLTDAELRELLVWLLDNADTKLRELVRPLSLNGSSKKIAESLDRAQMVQIICLVKDASIIAALDALVREERVVVPEGEVRSAVVNRDATWGPYRLIAEVSRLGVRVQALRSNIAPLRMREMIEKMYDLNSAHDRQELLWQLRAGDDEALERRLQRHLQLEDPRAVISKLALARRSNLIVASEYLKFDESDAVSDADLVDRIMWKLGFAVDVFPDNNADLFRMHEQIMLAIRQNDSDPSSQFFEDLRAACANYFIKLEEILRDSVSYVTWALSVDHFTSKRPYVYKAESDGRAALHSLNDVELNERGESKVVFKEAPTLYPLCRSFEVLAYMLADKREKREDFLRSKSNYPYWANKQTLQRFPFVHTVPFLDLAEDAQEGILRRLRDASRQLTGAEIPKLRNDLMHSRAFNVNLEELRTGLETVKDVLGHLEADGLCRLTYTMSQFEGDAMSREKLTLSHRRSYVHVLHLPSSYSWLRMPDPSAPQYIMSAARIRDSVEVLRFTRRVESPFSDMYDDYPRRPSGSETARGENLKSAVDI